MLDLTLIKGTLTQLSNQKSLLDILMEFERTIEETGVYQYLNWESGEIIDGPRVSPYWVTVKLMYPGDKMPDPRAGLRLEKIGCKVDFQEDTFKKPVKIHNSTDWSDPVSKKALLEDVNIWVVTIKMPKRYINVYSYDENYENIDTFSNEVSSVMDNKE